jgi:hypothetical protein
MSYSEWYQRSTGSTDGKDKSKYRDSYPEPYAYLRLDACLADQHCDSTYRGDTRFDNADFIYDDLSFFRPPNNVDKNIFSTLDFNKSRGIQCRFGTPGMISESHFDNERNLILMMGGARRYLLAHPKNCPDLYLFPQKHPLERHTQVNWSTIIGKQDEVSLKSKFPNFHKATVNEVVLQAGDILYLPTYWFHHIVSVLTPVNYQCNARTGYDAENDQGIYDCGFLYDFPTYQ